MNQKSSTSRAGDPSSAAMRPPPSADGLESWGTWVKHKHYSLEVVQHPLRARMCGFGDKDRRPLAPAAVAKMIVRREDQSVVDVDEIDVSFFLATVDLWSADAKNEMNLVLHPTSADKYVPQANPKNSKRRGGTASQRAAKLASPAPAPPTPSTSQFPQPAPGASYMQPTTTPYGAPPYGSYPAQPGVPEHAYQQVSPYGAAEPAPAWGYASGGDERPAHYPPPIHTARPPGAPPGGSYDTPVSAASGHGWPAESPARENGEYRWAHDAPYAEHNGGGGPSASPELRGPAYSAHAPPHEQYRYAQEGYAAPMEGGGVYAGSASYAQTQPQPQHAPPPPQPQPPTPTAAQYPPPPYAQETTPPSTIPPLPRHTYTRTLVGPLSANACRLVDEHNRPGIFFLFQDLSIRTEGTFRLRLRLMNVGAPPAPERGAWAVHTDVSPILAQTFTESFVVYSAKRFPGVPDTTPLSIALGNQGQKLPLRNRNGSSKAGRKRQRSGASDSGDESDDT